MNRNIPVKIQVQAKYVPDGFSVCKATGSKEYILNRSIKIYSSDAPKKEINVDEGCCFLISNGSINVIQEDSEVRITTDLENAKDVLNAISYEYETKHSQ